MKELLTSDRNLLHVSGSSYDIGLQHGKAAKREVQVSLATYEKMFKEFASLSWQQARVKAERHLKAIEQQYPEYLEEMSGLAKGAGVTFEDILILNARSEIALATSPDGCTSFALTAPKTSKTWLAQNWDWKGSQIDSLIHLKIEKPGLPVIEMVTEAGIIGKIGCNSEGIGVCLNALRTNTWEPKIPIHLGLRAILESASLEEAVSKTGHNQMASPAHFLIASAAGDAVSMEVSPVRTAQIKPSEGVLVHTNHLCAADMKTAVKENSRPDSFDRFSTMSGQMAALADKEFSEDELFKLLANHDNYPNSICRHDSPEQTALEKMETVFSIVMDLTDRKLHWIPGKPCAHYN